MDAWRRADAAYDPLDPDQSRPEKPSLEPWPGDPVWCGTCASRIRLALAELDDLIALLKATADGHRQATAAERVSGTAGGSSPSPALDDEDEAASMLAAWEDEYRRIRGWPSPAPRGELASVETACIAWLGRHLDGILRSPFAADFGREVLQWHRELAGASKAGVRVLRKPLRCPSGSCGMLTLVWEEGSDRVECANPECGLIMSYRQYEAELERLAG